MAASGVEFMGKSSTLPPKFPLNQKKKQSPTMTTSSTSNGTSVGKASDISLRSASTSLDQIRESSPNRPKTVTDVCHSRWTRNTGEVALVCNTDWVCDTLLLKKRGVLKDVILGMFMDGQPRIIACGSKLAVYGLLKRLVAGPAVMAVASIGVGPKGTILKVSIVQKNWVLLSFMFFLRLSCLEAWCQVFLGMVDTCLELLNFILNFHGTLNLTTGRWEVHPWSFLVCDVQIPHLARERSDSRNHIM